MKLIPLSQGKFAKVDDEDYEWLMQWKWSYHKKGYAVRTFTENGEEHSILMHRLIANTPKGMQTDHINGNKLDNQKNNLRICTNSENKRNAGAHTDNTSGFKGVSWSKASKSWQASITANGIQVHRGGFNTTEEAARVYNEMALKYHGEFARINQEVKNAESRK